MRRSMRLQPWTQLAEIVASAAVVITLLFLIMEVRGNTRAVERQIGLDGVARVTAPLINFADFAEIYGRVKAIDGPEPLTAAFAERYRLTLEQSVRWARYHHQLWLGLQADYLYSGPSARLDNTLRVLLSFPDSRLFWDHEKGLFTEAFAAHVEALRGTRPH
jgi:hypothetical protein